MFDSSLYGDQKLRVTITGAATKSGKPIAIDFIPTWSVESNPNLSIANISANGLSAEIVPMDSTFEGVVDISKPASTFMDKINLHVMQSSNEIGSFTYSVDTILK